MTSRPVTLQTPLVFAAVVGTTATVSVGSALVETTPFAATVVVLAVAAAIGIPHGAIDHRVAQAIRRPKSIAGFQIRFHLGYVTAMAVFGALWWQNPRLALGVFLVLSVHHFGQSDLARLRLERGQHLLQWSRGAFVVFVPLLAHLDRVSPIVADLGGGDPSTWAWLADHRHAWLGVTVGQHLAALAVVRSQMTLADRRIEVITVASLTALFLVADPLVGFAVYFGLWHALAHLLVLYPLVGGDERAGRFLAELVPRTATALVGVGAAALVLGPSGVLEATFVTLSLLTVPHLVVVEGLWRDSRPTQDGGRSGRDLESVGELVAS